MESKILNDQISWKDTYIIEKDNIKKIQKQFVYKSNIANKIVMNGIIYNHKKKSMQTFTKQMNGKTLYLMTQCM
jgi:hypothetical protein